MSASRPKADLPPPQNPIANFSLSYTNQTGYSESHERP